MEVLYSYSVCSPQGYDASLLLKHHDSALLCTIFLLAVTTTAHAGLALSDLIVGFTRDDSLRYFLDAGRPIVVAALIVYAVNVSLQAFHYHPYEMLMRGAGSRRGHIHGDIHDAACSIVPLA